MNTEKIIKELRFEIIKPTHDVSNFNSNYPELNDYLKNQALKDQEDSDKVTHLVIFEENVIGFFSLQVFFEGVPIHDYNKMRENISELPEREDLPLVEIKRFTMDKNYDDFAVAGSVFDNIIYNIKNIFKDHGCRGVAISMAQDCIMPEIA